MKLTREGVLSVDIEKFRPIARGDTEFYGQPGVEHYRLLAYLSTLFNGKTIIDIGTHRGDSALALSYNETNRVESFDIINKVDTAHKSRANVKYHLADLFNPAVLEGYKHLLLDSAMIMIDVDPHEGREEYKLVRWLQENSYAGTVVLDDIWYFKPMRDNLWYQLENNFKKDITHLGHWSGTGIVSFSEEIQHDQEADLSNWTLVTAYFDLTKMPDASRDIKARPVGHYLENAMGTLGADKNLIVFCEPENREQILSMRPRWLHERTRIHTMSFEDFPLTQYREQIIKNRGGACLSDNRNTASYYLLCMARYAMLKKTISDNPFNSTHFGWINICVERMGYKNLVHLDEALAIHRDKFSTCYIDYIPKELVNNLSEYFSGNKCLGRCSMCSGFFTGNAHYMMEFCNKIERQFIEFLNAGYGHADEQLFSKVYFDNPELFDWYLGDYWEMITNYKYVYDRPEMPLKNLIRNSKRAKDWKVCSRACQILLKSFHTGKCSLSTADINNLVDIIKSHPLTSQEEQGSIPS